MVATVTQPLELVIEPQTGAAVRVRAGDVVHVVDREGVQVADLWALVDGEPAEWLSPSHTRSATGRLFPQVGESFWTNQRRPVLRLVGDTSPGVHDMLYPPCDPWLFDHLGVALPHPSCKENFERALSELGLSLPAVPDSVNLFQNSPPDASGGLPIDDALSRPGDEVVLEVLLDAVVVVTACSVDVPPGNGARCTSIGLVIERASGSSPGFHKRRYR
jgi:uncharacterized protein YcgI (DUF1989 family)